MTEAELDKALKSKVPVVYQGRMEYETTLGHVSGIIRRHENGEDILSVELTSFKRDKSVLICRPSDIRFWYPVNSGEPT